MRQTRDERSFVHYYRIPWIATLLLSLLLAACNNGGKGPGYEAGSTLVAVDPFIPSRRLLYADYTVLCSRSDGTISDDPEGLYDHDTRVLSRRRLTIDGHDLTFVSSGDLGPDRRLTTLLAKQPGDDADGPKLPQDAIEVRIATRVGPGMDEHITLTNRSVVGLTPALRLERDGDFADVQEIGRARRRVGPGMVEHITLINRSVVGLTG